MNPPQDLRVQDHPVLGPAPQRRVVSWTWNDQQLRSLEGDSIAAALAADGVRALSRHQRSGQARGAFCHTGHCYECLVDVEGRGLERACLEDVGEGMVVRGASTEPATDRP